MLCVLWHVELRVAVWQDGCAEEQTPFVRLALECMILLAFCL